MRFREGEYRICVRELPRELSDVFECLSVNDCINNLDEINKAVLNTGYSFMLGDEFLYLKFSDRAVRIVDDDIPDRILDDISVGSKFRLGYALWAVDRIYRVSDPYLYYKVRLSYSLYKSCFLRPYTLLERYNDIGYRRE